MNVEAFEEEAFSDDTAVVLSLDDTEGEDRLMRLSQELLTPKDHRRIEGIVRYYRHEPHAFENQVWFFHAEDTRSLAILTKTRFTYCLKGNDPRGAAAVLRVVPWRERDSFYFSCVDGAFEKTVLRTLPHRLWPWRDLAGTTPTRHFVARYPLLAPPSEECIPGSFFTSLDVSEAQVLSDAWPYSFEDDPKVPLYVQSRIRDAPSICVRSPVVGKDAGKQAEKQAGKHGEKYGKNVAERGGGEIQAVAMCHAYGAVGALHVFDDFRRRGLGAVMMRKFAWMQLERGRTAYANTVVENAAGLKMMEAAGYADEGEDVWMFWTERHMPSCG